MSDVEGDPLLYAFESYESTASKPSGAEPACEDPVRLVSSHDTEKYWFHGGLWQPPRLIRGQPQPHPALTKPNPYNPNRKVRTRNIRTTISNEMSPTLNYFTTSFSPPPWVSSVKSGPLGNGLSPFT